MCKDGRRVMVIGLTHRQWRGLVKTLGMTDEIRNLENLLGVDLNDEGARYRHRAVITALFAPFFAARAIEDFAPDFEAAGLTWSVFRNFETALKEDEDLSDANPMFSTIDTPDLGTFPVPGSPINFSAHPRQAPAPAPSLGTHTEEILGDIVGLPDREIGLLFDDGVVHSPSCQRPLCVA